MSVDSDRTCDREGRLQEVLAAYYERIEAGLPPDPQSLIEGHPGLADELAEFFAIQDHVQHLVAPIRDLGDSPAATPRGPLDPRDLRAPGSPTDGCEHIGDYDLLGEIERGGVGIVYRARQRSLNRPVALKVLRDGANAIPVDARRFRNEAETVANLDHPNIIPIYEVGEDRGRSFFSMKLIEQGSLADRAGEFVADPRRAARLMVAVAHAIHYAHERGILHRDLKPSNILVDDRGQPHVADFGLARRLDGESDLTRTGMIVGTPSYMAPEQAGGEKASITTAADVHGLGAILYYLLTGRPPYGGATVLEILDRVRAASPRAPSTIQQAVDRDLETICLKCLDRDPTRRYPSADAVAADLERWLDGRPILARRVGRTERAWRLCRRYPRMTSLTTLAMLLAIVASAGIVAGDRARSEGERLKQAARSGERALRVERLAFDIQQSSRAWAANQPDEIPKLLESHRPAPGERDLRGFAWHYFRRLGDVGQPPLLGHTGDVHYATFSPDGKTLATAGKDKSVRLWEVATGSMLAVFSGHADEVNWVSYSPDGRVLATTGDDRTVRIWDAKSGLIRSTLTGHGDEVVGVIFTPDGRRVVSCDRKGRVIFWDLSESKIDRSFSVEIGFVQSLAISPDGRLLAIAGDFVAVRDLINGGEPRRLQTFEGPVNGVAFSHDGGRLAAACWRAVQVWETDDWSRPESYEGHQAYVESVAFSPGDRFLASVGHDGIIHLKESATGVRHRIATGQRRGRLWCVAFSADGLTLATTGADGTVRLWDLSRDRALVSFRLPTKQPVVAALSPDGARHVTADQEGRLWIHEARSGRLLLQQRFGAADEIVFSLLSSDAGRLVTMDRRGTITVWDVNSRRRLREIHASVPHFCGLAASPGGDWIARCVHGHGVFLWDIATGAERRLAKEWPNWVGMALSRDGRCAFWGDQVAAPFLWDAVSGTTRTSNTPGHDGGTVAWSFSPDGTILATGGLDGAVILRDGKSLELLSRFDRAHEGGTTAVAFSPDGRTLATGGNDGLVRLWDVEARRQLAALKGHSRPVWRAGFSADGLTLATHSYAEDGQKEVIIWPAVSGGDAAGNPEH